MFVEAEDVECGVRTGVPSLSDTPPLLCFAGLACAFVCTPDGPLQSPRWWLKGKPYQRLEPLRDNRRAREQVFPFPFTRSGRVSDGGNMMDHMENNTARELPDEKAALRVAGRAPGDRSATDPMRDFLTRSAARRDQQTQEPERYIGSWFDPDP